jgi:hypothetical protein
MPMSKEVSMDIIFLALMSGLVLGLLGLLELLERLEGK